PNKLQKYSESQLKERLSSLQNKHSKLLIKATALYRKNRSTGMSHPTRRHKQSRLKQQKYFEELSNYNTEINHTRSALLRKVSKKYKWLGIVG
ncbi:MAG: hypothetical protein Q7K54_03585, partial [Candidatus Parcubacteria bacterium]|nr:hypothetical protein [Candidatus Parcubacteria bacterium]